MKDATNVAGPYRFGPTCLRTTKVPTARFLGAVLLVALAVRAISLLLFTGMMNYEAAEYARLAQNLRDGLGYVGIDMPGENLMFPPLYPYLIAVAGSVLPDFETSARVISVIFGTATVLPVFFLARKIYGEHIGRIAAVLVALHPLLVHFVAAAYSEATYLFFVMAALSATVGASYAPKAWRFASAGALFGLAYLTRIEGAPLPFVAAGTLLFFAYLRYRQSTSLTQFVSAAGKILCLPALFLLVSAPYLFWLHSQTGQWRLEGKSPLNIETAERALLAGENMYKVHYEVDGSLQERGVWNRPYIETIRSAHLDPVVLMRYLAVKTKTNVIKAAEYIGGIAFGSPLFAGLALFGLYASSRRAIAAQAILVSFVVTALSQTLLVVHESIRFYVVLLPVFAIWAAAGGMRLYLWLLRKPSFVGLRPRLVEAALITAFVAVLGFSHYAALNRYELATFSRLSTPIKRVSQSLAQTENGKRGILVSVQSPIAYHADADWCPFPYSDSTTALRYFDKRKVGYIVLSQIDLDAAPYLRSWWTDGIPSSSAEFLRSITTTPFGEVRFYRWTPRGEQEPPILSQR